MKETITPAPRAAGDVAAEANQSAERPPGIPDDLLGEVGEYGFVLLDGDGRITRWNLGAERITGFSAEEALGAMYEILVPKEESAAEQSGGDSPVHVFDGSRMAKTGVAIWLHETTHRLKRTGAGMGGSLRIIHDVDSRLESVRALLESEQHHRRLIEWSPESILLHDAERILYANPAARRMFRARSDDGLVGRPLSEYLEPGDRQVAARLIQTALDERVPAGPVEVYVPRGAGGQTIELTMVPAQLGGHRIVQLIAHDISVRKQMEIQLQHQAFHDSLTRLPNRALFLEHLERGIAAVQRHPTRKIAVLYLDLDGFKQVNDTWGHRVGDRLLVEFAARLRRSVRPQDVVARLAGDEFTVLLEDLSTLHEAVGVAERVQRECGGLYQLVGEQIRVTSSLGIAFFTPESTPDSLLQAADVALYRAKSQGGGGYTIYDDKLHQSVMQRLRVETDLRQAVADETLRVAYEPLCHLASGDLAGITARLKWDHPVHGALPEGEFLSILTALGLLHPVAERALSGLPEQAATLTNQLGAGAQLRVPWALLQHLAESSDSLARVAAVLAQVQPSVAVPEAVLAQSIAAIRPRLDALRAHGFRMVVTNFGAGHLAIRDLERLGAVGVDVHCGPPTGVGETVLRGVVGLARALNLSVTAEGLASEEAWDMAAAAGCDYGRGALERRPRPG